MKIFKPEIFETKNAPNAPYRDVLILTITIMKKTIFKNLLFVLANELVF